jgi:hypothetical protein
MRRSAFTTVVSAGVGCGVPSVHPPRLAQGVDDLLGVRERARRDRLLHRETLVERQVGEQDAGVLVRRQRDRAEVLLDAAVDDDESRRRRRSSASASSVGAEEPPRAAITTTRPTIHQMRRRRAAAVLLDELLEELGGGSKCVGSLAACRAGAASSCGPRAPRHLDALRVGGRADDRRGAAEHRVAAAHVDDDDGDVVGAPPSSACLSRRSAVRREEGADRGSSVWASSTTPERPSEQSSQRSPGWVGMMNVSTSGSGSMSPSTRMSTERRGW